MKYILISFIALQSHLLLASSISDRVDAVALLIDQNPDSAYLLAEELMIDAQNEGNEYGVVQSNFILAYIHDEIRGEFGKAIIYYLEAIRYADDSSYDNVVKDRISLHKNCGVIFRKFKSYSLANEYYNMALDLALQSNNLKEIYSINYNISGLLIDQEEYNEAIDVLNDLISKTDVDSKNYWKYNNRLGNALFESKDYDQSIIAYNNALKYTNLSDKQKAYTLHNIGRSYSYQDLSEDAYFYLNQALEIKEQLSGKPKLFSTLSELGDLALQSGDIKRSLSYYGEAERFIDQAANLDYYQLYKSKADALFELKNFIEAKKYQDLYAEGINKYLEDQKSIQETDKRYNMDLITQRYFDQIDRQERIAQIFWWSKLISGSLLTMLLLTIGFNWYQKARLRKSILEDLIKLKVID